MRGCFIGTGPRPALTDLSPVSTHFSRVRSGVPDDSNRMTSRGRHDCPLAPNALPWFQRR